MDPKDEAEEAILDLREGVPMSPEYMEQAESGTAKSTVMKKKSNSEKKRKREKNSIKEEKKKKSNSRESRSRSKSNNPPVPVDRLSSLPDPIRDLIISFLPPSDATNTRILSKSWYRSWIQSPDLSFFHHPLYPNPRRILLTQTNYQMDSGNHYF